MDEFNFASRYVPQLSLYAMPSARARAQAGAQARARRGNLSVPNFSLINYKTKTQRRKLCFMANCVRIMKNHFAEKVAHAGDDNGENEREYSPHDGAATKSGGCMFTLFSFGRCLN